MTDGGTTRVGGEAPGASPVGLSPEGSRALRERVGPADEAVVRGLLEAVREPTLVLALNGAVICWNRAWEELSGRLPVAGSSSVFEVIPGEARAKWQGWLLRLVGGETLPAVQTTILRGSEPVRVEVVMMPVSLGEDRIVARVRFRDCTQESVAEEAQRAGDERFRMLCALAPMGVFQTDAQGRLTYTNQRWRNLAAMHSVDEPRGLWWQAVHPDDRPRVLQLWENSVRHGSEFVAEFRFLVDRGRVRWGRTRIAQHAGTDGRVAYFIGTSEDISDLKQVQADLAKARDAAMESARLKTEFLTNVSHEIRTPMNGVLGMLELLGATELTASQRRYASIARESAEILMGVIEDILDFSRLEEGRLRLLAEAVDLRELVGALGEQFRPQAEAKGLRLAVEADGHLPAWVRADPVRVTQVLSKLVANAVKFTEEGSISVRCLLLSADADRCVVRFEVQDTGIGIPREAQERIFQPFVQVDGGVTRRHGGSGLGLAVAGQLCELMGAEIRVESAPGMGATFWFDVTLPLAAGGG